MPHLVEEMYAHLPQKDSNSYFTRINLPPCVSWNNNKIKKAVDILLAIKKDVHLEVGAVTNNLIVDIKLSRNHADLLNVRIKI